MTASDPPVDHQSQPQIIQQTINQTDDPFGPVDSEFVTSTGTEHPSISTGTEHPSISTEDDPFAEAVIDEPLTGPLSPSAFAAFPKPSTKIKSKKSKKQKKTKQTDDHLYDDESLPTDTQSPVPSKDSEPNDTQPAAQSNDQITNESVDQNINSQESTQVHDDQSAAGFFPDSDDFVSHLEQQLARLKSKQEKREKLGKNKKFTEFAVITTSSKLNGTDHQGDAETSQRPDESNTQSVDNLMRPINLDEVRSILTDDTDMETFAEADIETINEESVAMHSSDGDAVAHVADKSEVYEHIGERESNCSIQ